MRTTDEGSTTAENAPDNVGRMVDWVLALELSVEDSELVAHAFSRCGDDNEHSLNQTLSYITRYPIFADIEVKKDSRRDPEVQLAIWDAAAMKKRKRHGWDTGLPMPAIVVDGPVWKWYLFFVMDDKVVSQDQTH